MSINELNIADLYLISIWKNEEESSTISRVGDTTHKNGVYRFFWRENNKNIPKSFSFWGISRFCFFCVGVALWKIKKNKKKSQQCVGTAAASWENRKDSGAVRMIKHEINNTRERLQTTTQSVQRPREWGNQLCRLFLFHKSRDFASFHLFKYRSFFNEFSPELLIDLSSTLKNHRWISVSQ